MFQLFENTVIHFIVPKSLLFNSYFKNIRELLIRKSHIVEVFTLKEKVFADAEVGDSLLLKINLPRAISSLNNQVALIAKKNFKDHEVVKTFEIQKSFLSRPNFEISIINMESKNLVAKTKNYPKIRKTILS